MEQQKSKSHVMGSDYTRNVIFPSTRTELCDGVHLSVRPSVCRQNLTQLVKIRLMSRFSQKLSNLELWSLLTTYRPRKSYMGFSNNPLLDP